MFFVAAGELTLEKIFMHMMFIPCRQASMQLNDEFMNLLNSNPRVHGPRIGYGFGRACSYL
jgi:hypothetical protein